MLVVVRVAACAIRLEFARDLARTLVDRAGVDGTAFVENRDHREEPAFVIAALVIIGQRFDAAPQFVDDELRAVRPRGIGERPHQGVDAHLPRGEGVLRPNDRIANAVATDIVLHRERFARERGAPAPSVPEQAGPRARDPKRASVKIAVSSATFAQSIAAGELSQLEWLDVCANELEADAVVFDAAQFPRTDGEYLAQLKKTAVDLGLAVAGVAADGLLLDEGENWLAVADRLGAPLALVRAPLANDDAGAWGRFTDALKTRAKDAKRRNVTLALRNVSHTLCSSVADLRRVAKDIDSAWLRFALDLAAARSGDGSAAPLAKSVIVTAALEDPTSFARPSDRFASDLTRDLARFRGCVLLEGSIASASDASAQSRAAFHEALRRFADLRARSLATATS